MRRIAAGSGGGFDPRGALLRHTRATSICLCTAADGEGVRVVIEDNGAGFIADEALQQGGRGLCNQQRRAQAIGGTVSWESSSAGTHFTLWLPLHHRVDVE